MGWSMWRVAAALLVVQAVAVPLCEARGSFGGGRGGGGFTPGVHYGGYPVGTSSYGGAGRGVGGVGRNWWGGAGGIGGIGGIGAYGYGGSWWGLNGGDTNSTYYMSPAQTSLPAVAAQDDTDVVEKMENRVPHQDGPSMSFQSMMPESTTDTFAQLNQDFSQIAGPVTYVPVPMSSTSTSAAFQPPRISAHYPSVAKASVSGTFSPSFSSGAANFTSQVNAKIASVQQVLTESIQSGQLGTFDVASLQSRLDAIKTRLASSPTDGAAQEQMLTDLGQLEYDIRQHTNSNQ